MALRARPLAIHLFTALFAASALVAFGDAMADLDGHLAWYAARFPAIAWNRDAVIVFASARLTIAAIPLVLVWVRASRFARWMATAFALLKLLGLPEALGSADGPWLASLALGVIGAAMLFTPASARWFARWGKGHGA